jgi:hypothetical protein
LRFLLLFIIFISVASLATVPKNLDLGSFSPECNLEAQKYEENTKSEVQTYVTAVLVTQIQTLMEIRDSAVFDGALTTQEKIDLHLAHRLNFILGRESLSAFDLKQLDDINQKLKTNPLQVSKELRDEVISNFMKSGL